MPLTRSMFAEDLAHDEPQPYLWTINFGPQHPATHTTLRLVLKLEGERVVDALPDIGYLHSGFEKLGESLDYNQYVDGHGPDELHLADGQQCRLAPGGGEAPRARDAAAMPVHPRPHCGAVAAERPFALPGGDGVGHRRLHALHLRLQSAGDDLRHLRGDVRRPLHQQLHPRGRPHARHLAGGDPDDPRPVAGPARSVPRHGAAAGPQPHLHRPHARRGRAEPGRGDRRSCSGPVARASGVARDLRRDEPYLAYKDFDFQVCCAGRATAWPAIASAWPKCGRASRSSSRLWKTSPPDR